MKKIKTTSKFRKDIKRFLNQPSKMAKCKEVIDLLEAELPLPESIKKHPLSGNYKGCFECHIEDDLLLIWIDESNDFIYLVRIGSHSELFG